MKLFDKQVSLFDFGQHAFASFVIRLTDLCDADAPRCPVQETRAQAFLQLYDLFTYRSAGNSHMARSRAKGLTFLNI